MSFETYPLPEGNRSIDALNERIAAQHEMLVPIVTKVFGALDGRVNEQAAVLGKINGKLGRALNGRIKQQQSVVNGTVAALHGALNDRIAEQGRALDLQSALLSRLAPAQQSPLSAPGGLSSGGTLTSPQPGGLVRPPLSSPVTSPTAGVTVPAFPLSPQQVIPQQFGGIIVPPAVSPESSTGAPPNWIVLANCEVLNWTVMDQSDPNFQSQIAGHPYVPMRRNFGGNYDSAVQWGRLHHQIIGYQDYEVRLVNPTKIACEAWQTNGIGWPDGGDFGSEIPTGYIPGDPVGDWPFDANGKWIGS